MVAGCVRKMMRSPHDNGVLLNLNKGMVYVRVVEDGGIMRVRVVANGAPPPPPPHPRQRDLVCVVDAGPCLQGAHNILN